MNQLIVVRRFIVNIQKNFRDKFEEARYVAIDLQGRKRL